MKDPDEFERELRERDEYDYVTAPNGGFYRPCVRNGVPGCWRYWSWSRESTFIVGFSGVPFGDMESVIRWAKADGRHEPGSEGTELSKRTLLI
jgi:hypothetical protein